MNTTALEARLNLLLACLEEQTSRGVERDCLAALGRKIQEVQLLIQQYQKDQDQKPVLKVDQKPEWPEYSDGERDPSDFRYGPPKKWKVRNSIRSNSRHAHPLMNPLRGAR